MAKTVSVKPLLFVIALFYENDLDERFLISLLNIVRDKMKMSKRCSYFLPLWGVISELVNVYGSCLNQLNYERKFQ